MGLRVRLTLALLLTIATLAVAPRPAGAADEIADALAFVNEARAQVGAAPLALHSALRQAAQSHVDYYRANIGDPDLAGMGLHQEKPGRPGFTGVEPEDRARAAGYPGRAINENAGLTGALIPSLRWHVATINHRLPLLDPRYRDIGFGVVNEGRIRFDIVLVGAPSWPSVAQPDWIAWPPDGAEGIGLSYSGESPNPFPGQRYPVGYPITLGYFGPGAVQFTGAALRSADGASVPIVFRQGDGWHSRRTALIVAVEPLARGGAYAVEARGTANGAPFSRGWRFTTIGAPAPSPAPPPAPRAAPAATPTPVTVPPGVAAADEAVRALWQRSDGRLAAAGGAGGWLWGPDVFADRAEPYAEAPGGQRTVYYFDKSRMEITDPVADRRSPWFVTNGLLVREMVTGTVQVGHGALEERGPADLPAVGDAANNPKAPAYATFLPLAGRDPAERRAESRVGQPVTATLRADGRVGSDKKLGRHASVATYHEAMGRNIPNVFWDWMAGLDGGWEYVLGLPLTEPHWTRARVNGVERDVLVQLFERRALTYTPTNAPAWQVEMGNVGRHYHQWRYGDERPAAP